MQLSTLSSDELSIVNHEILNPLAPGNPRADALAINPQRYSKHADSKETRTENIEHSKRPVLRKPRIDKVRLRSD
jgi:hypothetical protein